MVKKQNYSNNIHDHNQDFSPKGVFLEAIVAKFLSLVQPKAELQDPV